MRKFQAIFLLTVFSLSSLGSGELLKIPSLVLHLGEHLRTGKSENVSAFFIEHYGGDHNDDDGDEDRQLPFVSVQLINIICLLPAELQSASPMIPNGQVTYPRAVQALLPDRGEDIFHPPC